MRRPTVRKARSPPQSSRIHFSGPLVQTWAHRRRPIPARSLLLKVHDVRSAPRRVEVNGQTLELQAGAEDLEKAAGAWRYDETANLVLVKLPDQAAAVQVRIEK